MTNDQPETWNLKPLPRRPPHAQLERTPLSPTLTPQQLTNINRNTFSKLERPAVPSPTLDLGPRTSNMKLETGAPTKVGHLKPCADHSSTAPKRSSTLPNRSSNRPKPSRTAQLEPFPDDPIFTTLSRQTTCNSAREKSASDLSASQSLPPTLPVGTRVKMPLSG
jgi:hypothetical protein